jgi:UDP-N-acetylmuramate dehydrogenase
MDITRSVNDIAARFPDIRLRRGEPLRGHTSLRIGGPVTAMFFPNGEEQLAALLAELGERGIAPVILGNGTNLLADDRGFDAVVVKTTGLSALAQNPDGTLRTLAGTSLRRLAEFARERSLEGLEFAHGIPGTLGGAVVMNAGAYGGSIGDVAVAVRSLPVSGTGGVTETPAAECGFEYRHSVFGGGDRVVVSADIALRAGDAGEISAKMEDYARRRRQSQPLGEPSAGSAFRRPPGGYAAELIDAAGLKGLRVGGARVSEKHAGFIVNGGDAAFEDVVELMGRIIEAVERVSGLRLEPEVKILRRDENGGARLWNF